MAIPLVLRLERYGHHRLLITRLCSTIHRAPKHREPDHHRRIRMRWVARPAEGHEALIAGEPLENPYEVVRAQRLLRGTDSVFGGEQ